jgi:hypothetical protein
MLINKLKTCKAIDLDSKFKEYVIKNYDDASLTDKIKSYFSEINQCRSVMSQMGEVQDSIDQLKQNISIILSYINMLSAIKQKMTFGKESYSCKIEFTWTDTIKGSKYSSYNIFFEIYNSMFNLATCYYNLATQLGKNATEKIGHKEACKYYRQAMYLYDVIKEEANLKIIEKELPLDLFPPHLDYCKILCEIQGQLEIYYIATETSKKDFTLRAKLLNVVSELYANAKVLSEGPQTKKGTKDELEYFLINRSEYYKALMYKELREESRKKFDDVGEGYGEMIFYQGRNVASLLECQKTIKKCGKLVNADEFENNLKAEQNEGANMLDLNERIYHQRIPQEEEIVLEKKNMMNMVLPEGLYIRENSEKLKNDEKAYCSDLDLLVPKQVKSMIENYKNKMNELISKNLDLYENDLTIQKFVKELYLPRKLTIRPGEEDLTLPPVEIPIQLWQKLEQVKSLGGPRHLANIMQGIMNKSNFLINELENLLRSLEAEDKDDQMYRQQYKEKWIREPSQKLNFKLVQGAQQYIASLNNTKKYDIQENNEIMDNAKFFDELMLPRDQLLSKIPRREELEEKEIPEEKEVRESIMKLYELGDKCMNIIRPIFNELNDDSNIVGQFIEVLAKKTTENAIFEKYKEEYMKKLDGLKILNDEIKKQKDVVNQTLQKNMQKIRDKQKPPLSNEAIEFFNYLDQYANLFMNKYEKIKKGDNYYNDIYQKISSLIKNGEEWMIKRSDEKNVILGTIKGAKTAAKLRLTESALLDPKRNPFTNAKFGKK